MPGWRASQRDWVLGNDACRLDILPILYADQLVGKLDAAADREAGVLRVHAIHAIHAIHQDIAFTKVMTAAVDREIEDLAHWLGLDLTLAG